MNLIELLHNEGFLDQTNFEKAMKNNFLYNRKFIHFKDSAFQFMAFEFNSKLDNIDKINKKCIQLENLMKKVIFVSGDYFYDDKGWAALDYLKFKVTPIKYSIFQYGAREWHTYLVVKVIYDYDADLLANDAHGIDRIVQYKDDIDGALEQIKDIKNGLKLTIEHTINSNTYTREGGYLSFFMEMKCPTTINFVEAGELNEENVEKIISSCIDSKEFVDL